MQAALLLQRGAAVGKAADAKRLGSTFPDMSQSASRQQWGSLRNDAFLKACRAFRSAGHRLATCLRILHTVSQDGLRLDLTRLTRDEDEDDEDFENKAATLPPSNVASGSEIAWEQEQHSAHNMRQASSNQHGKSGNSTTKNSMSGIKVSRNVQDMDKPKPDDKQQNWSTHQAEEVCGEGHSGVVRF